MFECKDIDYLEHAEAVELTTGETHTVKAKYVREDDQEIIFFNKTLITRKEVEVLRLNAFTIDYYEKKK